MTETCKGEALIKRKPTRAEQYSRGQAAVQSAAYKRRTNAGSNMSKAGGAWSRKIKATEIEAGKGSK
ncbi:MAG: hypothetical protein ACK4VZ_15910 [Paracoccaceae bacterium]